MRKRNFLALFPKASLVLIGLLTPSLVPAAQPSANKQLQQPSQSNRLLQDNTILAKTYEINGRITSGGVLRGYGIVVTLRKDGRVQATQRRRLDSTGSYRYRFIRLSGPGNYTVSVANDPGVIRAECDVSPPRPESCANPGFIGTDPASPKAVVLTKRSWRKTQNFTIRYRLYWDSRSTHW